METVGYCVRVQALEGYGSKIAMLNLVDDYDGILGVKHSGSKKENPHYHIVIRTKVKEQALRVRLKKLFTEGKGNQHMSIKPWDGDDKALSYLFHELEPDEQHTLIVSKGLTPERIEELRQKNDAVKLLVATAKNKASWTLEEEVYQDLVKYVENQTKEFTDIDIAMQIYQAALSKDKYPPQPWLVRAMVTKIRYRLLLFTDGNVQQFIRGLATDLYFSR